VRTPFARMLARGMGDGTMLASIQAAKPVFLRRLAKRP